MFCLRGAKTLKIITGVINFELTQHIRPRSQADGWTVGRLSIAMPRFTLRASRDKTEKEEEEEEEEKEECDNI